MPSDKNITPPSSPCAPFKKGTVLLRFKLASNEWNGLKAYTRSTLHDFWSHFEDGKGMNTYNVN